MTLDRIDNNAGYEKSNCRWASYEQQARNRRSTKIVRLYGKEVRFADLPEKYNIPYDVLHARIYQLKWSMEKAVETPYNPRKTTSH